MLFRSLDKKIPKSSNLDEDNLVISKKGLYYSNLLFIIFALIITYMIIPGLKGSGFLLGEGNSYIERLIGESSHFNAGLSLIILIIIMSCGYLYGKVSGNIKNSNEYSVALSKNFESLGYAFVLLFFASKLISIFEWTNLGKVICSQLISLMTFLPFSGIPNSATRG